MAFLELKDKEIEKLNINLVQMDIEITSLRVVTQKDQEAKEAINSKNRMKEKLFKYNKKLMLKTILKEVRYALLDQLVLEATKFRTHIEVVHEEFETRKYNYSKM